MASDKEKGKGHSCTHAPEARLDTETTLRPISHAPMLFLRHRLAEGRGGEGKGRHLLRQRHITILNGPTVLPQTNVSDRPLKRSFYAILMQRYCVMRTVKSLLIWVQALQ